MCVTNFVKDVWVATGHVCDDDVGRLDLLVYLLKNRLIKPLIVNALTTNTDSLAGQFDSREIDVLKFFAEWHQNEYEFLRSRRTAAHWIVLLRIRSFK